jgi:hypothetical protein
MEVEKAKEICQEMKTVVYNLEEHIKESERQKERIIELNERPAAGIRTNRPTSSHHYWINGLRTQNWWRRANNY